MVDVRKHELSKAEDRDRHGDRRSAPTARRHTMGPVLLPKRRPSAWARSLLAAAAASS